MHVLRIMFYTTAILRLIPRWIVSGFGVLAALVLIVSFPWLLIPIGLVLCWYLFLQSA